MPNEHKIITRDAPSLLLADEWETAVREEKDDGKTAGGRRVTDTSNGRRKGSRREGIGEERGVKRQERGERVVFSGSVCRAGASSVAAHHPDRLGAAVMSARRVRVSDADVHVVDVHRRDRLPPA